MPTVLRMRGYRFFFYSNEGDEPRHVHVERGSHTAKFWLSPVELAGRSRFSDIELARIRSIIVANEGRIKEAWRDHFDS